MQSGWFHVRMDRWLPPGLTLNAVTHHLCHATQMHVSSLKSSCRFLRVIFLQDKKQVRSHEKFCKARHFAQYMLTIVCLSCICAGCCISRLCLVCCVFDLIVYRFMLPGSTPLMAHGITLVITAVDVVLRYLAYFTNLALGAGWGPKLYLRRNLHSSMRKGAPPAQRVSRLSQCYVRNGLECKLKQDDGGNSVCP